MQQNTLFKFWQQILIILQLKFRDVPISSVLTGIFHYLLWIWILATCFPVTKAKHTNSKYFFLRYFYTQKCLLVSAIVLYIMYIKKTFLRFYSNTFNVEKIWKMTLLKYMLPALVLGIRPVTSWVGTTKIKSLLHFKGNDFILITHSTHGPFPVFLILQMLPVEAVFSLVNFLKCVLLPQLYLKI